MVGAAVLFFAGVVLGFSDLQNILAGPSPAEYFLAQLQHHVFHYLRNFAWPFEMRMGAVDEAALWQSATGGLLLLASWVLAWRWRRTRPLLVFCLLSYQGMLLLTSSVLPLHGGDASALFEGLFSSSRGRGDEEAQAQVRPAPGGG